MKEKVTPAQQILLDKWPVGATYTAYQFQASLATLDALTRKGYLKKEAKLGLMFFPRNEIYYTRIKVS